MATVPSGPPGSPAGAQLSTFARVKRWLVGKPRDLSDPGVFHRLSLMAFLAWVGLGADGLSSSAYGPEEAFKALGAHTYLAVALAAASALTVLVISAAYAQIIRRFPFGGGGYLVASRLLGPRAGLVSGAALVVDYVLTITVSIAAGADAIFSFLPPHLASWKLPVVFAVISGLMLLNLRGVKESVTVLAPIFLGFLATHAVLIVGILLLHLRDVAPLGVRLEEGWKGGLGTVGAGGLLAILLRAYSMGAGTYTGIEAVSNGLTIMREPKVQTARRTMALMATSLAVTAGGIILGYLLLDVSPVPGRTMNAVLADGFAGSLSRLGLPVGGWFVTLTLVTEALLLFVAAQAGFIDGPRVMANMATDSWLPHRFAQLSERLTMQNGVVLMGGASLAALLYTRGDVTHLVVMYSINVFLTFTLSQAAMCRYWWERRRSSIWKRRIWIHVLAFLLCAGILAVTIYEKLFEGGWVTIAVTGALVVTCAAVRRHYRRVQSTLGGLDDILGALPTGSRAPRPSNPGDPTAVLLVGAYTGLGVHQLLAVQRLFPDHFRRVVFVSVAVIDAATFKGVEEVEELRERILGELVRYVELAERLGLAAEYRLGVGTDVISEAEEICRELQGVHQRAIFFAGKLIFQAERWYQRLLHNETAYALQRRLQFAGASCVVLPVRVMEAR